MRTFQFKRVVYIFVAILPGVLFFQNCGVPDALGPNQADVANQMSLNETTRSMLKGLGLEVARANNFFQLDPGQTELQFTQPSESWLRIISTLKVDPHYKFKFSIESETPFDQLALQPDVRLDRLASRAALIESAIEDNYKLVFSKQDTDFGLIFSIGAIDPRAEKAAPELLLTFECVTQGQNDFLVTASDVNGVLFSRLPLTVLWESTIGAAEAVKFSSDLTYYETRPPVDEDPFPPIETISPIQDSENPEPLVTTTSATTTSTTATTLPAPPSNKDRLLSGEWSATEIDGQPIAPASLSVTLALRDNRASGFSGCNSFSSSFSATESSLSFILLSSSMIGCADENATMTEESFLQRLQAARSYEIASDGKLLIRGPEGTIKFKSIRK